MTMTMMMLAMGTGESMARFYYGEDDDYERRRLITTVILGPGLLSLPLIVLIMLSAGMIQPLLGIGPDFVVYLQLAILTAWFSMIAEIGYAYLRMRYFSKTFVAITVFQILSSVGLNLLLVVVFDQGIWGILYSTFAVQATVGVLMTLVILMNSRAWPSWRHLRRLLGFGVPLVPATVTLQLSNYLSPLMIRWWVAGDPAFVLAQVGLFAAGQKIGVVVNRFVTVPFNAFWRPRRMELVMQNTPEVKSILARICTYAVLVSAQVALLLSVSVENLLQLVVDERYWDAYRVVPIIACVYVVLGLEHHFSVGIYYTRKTIWATWIGVLSLLTIVALNWCLLPHFGFMAAAFATLVGISLRSGLLLTVSQRLYPIPFELRRLALVAMTGVLLYHVSQLIELESVELTLLARMTCGLAFVPVLAALRFFWPDERQACWNLLSRRIPHWRRPLRQSSPDWE
jgi:O-antigen/teichoic acid export membrane protein